MSGATNPVTSPATLTAVDADGDDFALDFGMTDLPGVTPAREIETDKVAHLDEANVKANLHRAEWYREKGYLP